MNEEDFNLAKEECISQISDLLKIVICRGTDPRPVPPPPPPPWIRIYDLVGFMGILNDFERNLEGIRERGENR
jgi:hypothetical protein